MSGIKSLVKIGTTDVQPGQHMLVNLPVGKLPVGHRIYLQVNVYNALQDGPVLLFMGGLHGDEVNGVETMRRAISSGMFNKISSGAVVAISLINIYGFINFSRDLPDGKDVNRSFPGNANGSLASRIASVVTKKILPAIDMGVDFHTGGAQRYNYPQIRYNRGDQVSHQLAKIFNAPVFFEQNTIAKSFRKIAKGMGKPILVFEGGEALRLDEYSIHAGLDGINNLLVYHNMVNESPRYRDSLHFQQSTWVRAAQAGIFNSFFKSGQRIQKGVPLGSICDPYGDQMHIVSAKRDGFVIGHNNTAVVNQGDALFHIAYSE